MDIGNLTSLGGLTITTIGALFGIFRYMTAQAEGLRREINAVQDNTRLLIEKSAEAESKLRHSLAAQMTIEYSKQEIQLRDLQRTTVRHEQMDAVEIRLNASLGKIETKVDRMAEQLTEIIAIKSKLDIVMQTMTRINDRFDEENGIRKNTRVPA